MRHKIILLLLSTILGSCSKPFGMQLVELDLPGKIVIYDVYEKEFLIYTEDKSNPFVPINPQPTKPLYDTAYANELDISPNGKWKVGYDPVTNRWMVFGPNGIKRRFKYFSVSPSMDWSPDGRYVVYRADGDENEWVTRIFILDLQTGKSFWIGEGGTAPRWYSNNVVLE